ncbi:MAG: SpoIIE family protein phosphatase, partial [Candidatus Delongbacteria bacterium]|nr:SpoIIE family protein phosphatase [Candidatus Delongbacteria bacterium]
MNDFFTDTGYFQKAKHGQNSFGDVIAKKYIKEEDRKIIVLSDGMGSGIKANVLASLTASMALNFTEAKKDIDKASELIMNILPKCSERKISYSTFTILDLKSDGKLSMIVYDAPLPVLISEGSEKEIKWNTIELTSGDHKGKTIFTAVFSPKLNDRLFAFTDGIAQSGLGTGDGEWGREAAAEYLIRSVKEDPGISAADIAE